MAAKVRCRRRAGVTPPVAARTALAVLLAAAPRHSLALQCGFASSGMPACPRCLETAVKTGKLAFWWNWKTEPAVDMSHLTEGIQAELGQKFVPMLWGQSKLDGYDFLESGRYIMGYNEPDQYGPSCFGEWAVPPYGCTKGETRPATSSGWAPLFDPSISTNGQPRAAQYWQWTINDMTTGGKRPRHSAGVKVVSPSMAQGAEPAESCIGVDPAQNGALKFCQGWLKVFKENTLKLDCTDFDGTRTNCWDVIDAIQIHAYSRSAEEVKEKIEGYYKIFQEDFEGTNGRKKKTLWLTEVAMGSNEISEILPFVETLMNPKDGLSSSRFPYLERVSWFSEHSFSAFHVKGYWPKKYEVWSSSLFDSFGTLSPLGKKFFSYCENVSGDQERRDLGIYDGAEPSSGDDQVGPSWSYTIHG